MSIKELGKAIYRDFMNYATEITAPNSYSKKKQLSMKAFQQYATKFIDKKIDLKMIWDTLKNL